MRLASLSLLTAHNRTTDRLFSTANATSAATALASRMAAQVMAAYPGLWPETVRGLIVHSAEWTPAMKAAYLPDDGPQKNAYLRLIQRCGFGVPDLQRALWTLDNSLTMIVESGLQPYEKESGKDPTTRDMHLHELPWPRGVLEDLGNEQVEMRITLSYFIEPNPSQRGYSRYRYESHGLRFDVKRPTESTRSFRARVNAAAEGQGTSSASDDPFWLIGVRNRHRGSLHSDVWRGPAVELANRANVAVFPTPGWWRLRHRLGSVNRSAATLFWSASVRRTPTSTSTPRLPTRSVSRCQWDWAECPAWTIAGAGVLVLDGRCNLVARDLKWLERPKEEP